jgi:hypothetical protein
MWLALALLCGSLPVLQTAPGSAAPRAPRVLACFWGLDRAADVTFASFQKFVLNPLDADLCAAVPRQRRDGSGAWHAAAKYLDVYDEPASLSDLASARAVSLARNSSLAHLRRDNFLQPTGLQQMHSRMRVWQLIEANNLLNVYDWFVLCRTDLKWLAPLQGFVTDSSHSMWVPYAGRKSDWSGYYDRVAVVHKSHVRRVLTMLDAVSAEAHPFLDALRGYPGSVGASTKYESFYRQYLEHYGIPVKRFSCTWFVTTTTASFARPRVAQLNNDTGHTYKYTDEYVAALNSALSYYRQLQAPTAAAAPAGAPAGQQESADARRFYVITIDEAERTNRPLKNCALSAWAVAVYERLLSHPQRTKHASKASVAFAPPHFAWDFHWPHFNGNRQLNAARPDTHFPLPQESGGYEPYGSSLLTSCRTFFAPCGYEGCVPEFGARRFRELLDGGEALSADGVLEVLEKLYQQLNFVPGRQSLVFFDSGAAGPVAYQVQPGGYFLPARAYRDERFIFALADSLQQRFRHGRDISLPTPWTEDVRRYGVRTGANRTYFLTFKGSFATARAFGNVRERARNVLHDPALGIIIVDSASDDGGVYSYQQLMYDTTFALILRGDQPYSYRYTEVVCSGTVPVMVLSDGWVPPFSSLHPFTEYGVQVTEDELPTLVGKLRAMKPTEVERLRYAAKQFCMQHLITVHQQTDSMVDSALLAA